MHRLTKSAGFIFLAAASVYAGQSIAADQGKLARSMSPEKTEPTVKLVEDTTAAAPTTPASSTDPFEAAAPVEQVESKGTNVTSSQVQVSDAGTVEIHVSEANLVEVLRMLSLQSQKNIIASKDVHGTITANLYNVTVREALDSILHANGFAYREKGNFIYVYTVKEMEEIEKSERKTTTEVFRLFYTPAGNAVTMVKPVLSPDAQVSFTTPATSGISSGTSDVGGNSHAIEDIIVISDYPENLDRVREVLKEVDRRPQQILIEATILRASLSEDNALGVDFTVMGGVDFSTLNASGSSPFQALTPQIIANPGASGVVDKGYAGSGTGFTGGVPNGGLKVGVVYNNVAVFLSALESVTDTVILANPKVLALNKQKGEVIVGRKDGYLTTTVTESSSVQTVEFLDTGTRLIFRPYIGDDGYIRMEIHPEDSSGGLTGANLPFKVTTEVTSNVMVKDGHTIVIGGLFREDSSTARSQVPFLGNLPIAGYLFRNQRDRTTREEIIIMLTPHIVKDDDSFSKEAEELMKDSERLRVGVRKGMMPFGRERLAESAYQSAILEMQKPNPDREKALWHLNCATNLNPKFLEAIKMKEQLSGEVVTTVDSSSIRGFVKQAILNDAGSPTTMPSSIRFSHGIDHAPVTEPAATTMPVMDVPATQPAATQPVYQAQAITKPEEPTTMPSQAKASSVWMDTKRRFGFGPKPEAKVESEPVELVVSTPATQPVAQSETTQPANVQIMDENPGDFTVTELPVDETK